jgi:hypothetical protein
MTSIGRTVAGRPQELAVRRLELPHDFGVALIGNGTT